MGKKGKMSRAEKNEAMWGLLFVAPTMIGLFVLNFYPIVYTIYQSFCKTGDFGRGNVFVGLSNYEGVLTSSEFWGSLVNTVKYALIEVPFGIALGLLLAVFLNRKIAFRSGYRTIFFLPMVAAPAAVAMVWKFLYNQQFGLLNNLFGLNIAWISDSNIAWISIGVIGVWSIVGYNMILFLSGLQEIPHDYYEAAMIDGASGIQQFFHVTVPLLSATTFFILQTRIIGALQVFDLIYMVMDTTNQALSSVQSVVYLFYKYAFTNGNRGYGAAIVVCMLVFIMAITFLLQRAEKKWVYYD
ncbi:MAG: sugar ABC transporter permease [Lachnospiraceae bacterium]|nr:sugar ABC transporter permease [Clostridiales bacterium]MCD8337152.1 sugar ABC transporter permease [Lachnospiraceae bacterium]MCD8347362.1 sugar ABC transporter permease [Lachnospiraceae bacterium]MCD8397323.1 sugar ABC transporter permease [Lachnospiraceae bacterium]